MVDALPEAVTWSIPADIEQATHVRAEVAEVLRRWGCGHLVDDATVVTSELVTNALRHGAGERELRLSPANGGVLLEVSDTGDGWPHIRDDDPLTPGGLGLVIVDRISADWGAARNDRGKVVWALLGPPRG